MQRPVLRFHLPRRTGFLRGVDCECVLAALGLVLHPQQGTPSLVLSDVFMDGYVWFNFIPTSTPSSADAKIAVKLNGGGFRTGFSPSLREIWSKTSGDQNLVKYKIPREYRKSEIYSENLAGRFSEIDRKFIRCHFQQMLKVTPKPLFFPAIPGPNRANSAFGNGECHFRLTSKPCRSRLGLTHTDMRISLRAKSQRLHADSRQACST